MMDKALTVSVIDAFGGLTATARSLGHANVTTVQGWRERGSIPKWRWPEVYSAAAKDGVGLPGGFVDLLRGQAAA